MTKRFIVRDKHTLDILATYTNEAQCYADWFTREGGWWVPRQPVVVTREGGFADWVYRMAKGQRDE